MNQEEILRDALAFILSQRAMDPVARTIAFKALKQAYPTEIPGYNLHDWEGIMATDFEDRWNKLFPQRQNE